MNIFNLFGKRKTEIKDIKPATILMLTQEYVPEYYRDSQHFKDSINFLKNNKWGLALDSLIEMASESGHYFSEDFWLDLASCADKMQLTKQADYCRQQIIRNQTELGQKTPKGWTTIKTDTQTREHKIAQVVEDKWIFDRRKKDNFNELILTNGFHIKYHGRSGIIYYVDSNKVLEIGFEMSGVSQYDLLLYFDTINAWAIPKGDELTFTEQTTIRNKLLEWLKHKRIKSDLL